MYIQLGSDMAVRDTSVLGVFDLDNCTCSKRTKKFLKRAEEEGQIVTVTEELPKAFVLTEEYGMQRVYLTQLASGTIEKRMK